MITNEGVFVKQKRTDVQNRPFVAKIQLNKITTV